MWHLLIYSLTESHSTVHLLRLIFTKALFQVFDDLADKVAWYLAAAWNGKDPCQKKAANLEDILQSLGLKCGA